MLSGSCERPRDQKLLHFVREGKSALFNKIKKLQSVSVSCAGSFWTGSCPGHQRAVFHYEVLLSTDEQFFITTSCSGPHDLLQCMARYLGHNHMFYVPVKVPEIVLLTIPACFSCNLFTLIVKKMNKK